MKDKRSNGTEEIDIDKRDTKYSNSEIYDLIINLEDITKPVYNSYGYELNNFSRFIKVCDLVSYITDEYLLTNTIVFLKDYLETKDLFKHVKDEPTNFNPELYTVDDLTKIRAICFSLKAKYLAFMDVFYTPNSYFPELNIVFDNRIITHNLPFVTEVIFRNFEIEFTETLKNLPFDNAYTMLNKRIESFIALDYLHNTNISSETIEFLEKCKKMLVDNAKHTESFSQPKPLIYSKNTAEIKNEQHNHIFKDNAFEVWQSMFDEFGINESSRTDVKFMFEEMKKEGLIHNSVNQVVFLDWIRLTYDGMTIERTSNYHRSKVRLQAFSRAKELYKK